jgi:hypothetical protein
VKHIMNPKQVRTRESHHHHHRMRALGPFLP